MLKSRKWYYVRLRASLRNPISRENGHEFARSEIRPQRFVSNPQLSPGNRGIYAPQPYAVALDSRKIVLG